MPPETLSGESVGSTLTGQPGRLGELPEIDGYELIRIVGRGGMGVVYHAKHIALNREVALKVILAGEHAVPEEHYRFLTEAEIVAKMQHPHIVSVYDLGNTKGRPYFTMEFVTGGNLRKRVAAGMLNDRDAATMMLKLARATHYAHEHGIVHRDLKPDNVLLTEAGEPKITDFGVAKRLAGDKDLTRTGAILGTPAFMSPEQAAGRKQIGPAADTYALGAMLYYCLTGRPPFDGESVYDTMHKVMTEEAVSPAWYRPGISRDLETICLKCLRKKPEDRYASAGKLADDLERFLARRPIQARKVGVIERAVKWGRRRPAAAAVIVAMAAIAGIVAGLAAWYYDKNLRLHESYFASWAKRHGAYVGIGPLSLDKVRQRPISYKFYTRAGRVERIDVVDDQSNRIPAQFGLYYLDSIEGTNAKLKRECTYRLTYDAQGRIAEELAYDADERLVYRLHYTTPTMAAFTDANGFPVARFGSGAAYIEFVRNDAGQDVELRYRDRDSRPRPDADGAYGWRIEYGPTGIATRITLMDETGQPHRIKAGYAAVEHGHDASGNVTHVRFLDEKGKPASHASGHAGLSREYDEFGRLVLETYLDQSGKPQANQHGIVHIRRKYEGPTVYVDEYPDIQGNLTVSRMGMANMREEIVHRDERTVVIRRTWMDAKGKPTRIVDWSAGEVVTTSRNGLKLSHEFLGPDGKTTTCIEGFARSQMEYDERGNMIAWQAFDISGSRTRDFQWVSRKTLRYDDRNRCIEERFFDMEDRPTLCKQLYAMRVITYDTSSNVSSEQFFGVDEKPIRSRDGISRAAYEYDERGHVAVEKYFAPDGKPTWHKKGYVSLNKKHDARGNLIVRKAFAADGAAIPDWSGVHEFRYEYDDWGHLILERRFNADDSARLGADGAAGIKNTLDRFGRTIEVEYLGFRNEAILSKSRFAREFIERDPAGRPIRRTYVGLDNKPTLNEDGVARVDMTNDPLGNATDIRYFDASGKPALYKRQYHRLEQRFSDRSLVERETHYGLDGTTPVRGPEGAASAELTHDERGQPASKRFFAPDGMPGEHDDGNHLFRRRYDDRGLKIEESYFDREEKPINLRDSGARNVYTYDHRGNRLTAETIGADGKLVIGPIGAARIERKYDDRDNCIDMRYFGIDGKPCRHIEGNAALITTFNDCDQETEHTFLDSDEKPVEVLKYGYAKWAASYDMHGNGTDQQYFDASNKPMNGPNGWARLQAKYDEFGREIEKLVTDAKGQQLQTRIVVLEVIPGGAGAKMGLKEGDVIQTYDGKPVTSVSSFTKMRDQEKLSDPPKLMIVLRGSEEKQFQVTPGRMTVNLIDRLVPKK
jgi:predicted Ser/Thr protein kinase